MSAPAPSVYVLIKTSECTVVKSLQEVLSGRRRGGRYILRRKAGKGRVTYCKQIGDGIMLYELSHCLRLKSQLRLIELKLVLELQVVDVVLYEVGPGVRKSY